MLWWSAIFIKCFTLEYLVIQYEVPIDSTLYVWSLSLFMASVATIIKLKPRINDSEQNLNRVPWHRCIWAFTAAVIIIISGIELLTDWANDINVLPIHAVLIGLSYTGQGILLKYLPNIISAFGWWIGAALLFRIQSPNDLILFAACILLFSTLPMCSEYRQLRNTEQSALVS